MKRIILFILFLLVAAVLPDTLLANSTSWWPVQSVDTMKYSRDVARAKLQDDAFDIVIETQIKNIASSGATHVAIATPYDDEFLPFLRRWVKMARKYNLNVWYRGNFSGWEGWFEYPKIDRVTHLTKTRDFLTTHPELFEDGDIFTPCPECENGGAGDPRKTGDTKGFRKFLIDEYRLTKDLFAKMNKSVSSNYASMNGDVVRLIMDQETTKAMDGIVTVDHYVKTPEKLVADIKEYARLSGGKVVLGEWGVPIPDIHGNLSEEKQAEWLENALSLLAATEELTGLNYWTGYGASTSLWSDDIRPKPAAETLTKYYSPKTYSAMIRNEFKQPLANVHVKTSYKEIVTDAHGKFTVPYQKDGSTLEIAAAGYLSQTLHLSDNNKPNIITLKPENPHILYRVFLVFYRLINPL